MVEPCAYVVEKVLDSRNCFNYVQGKRAENKYRRGGRGYQFSVHGCQLSVHSSQLSVHSSQSKARRYGWWSCDYCARCSGNNMQKQWTVNSAAGRGSWIPILSAIKLRKEWDTRTFLCIPPVGLMARDADSIDRTTHCSAGQVGGCAVLPVCGYRWTRTGTACIAH
jgi:hypothetical protein